MNLVNTHFAAADTINTTITNSKIITRYTLF